MSRPLRRPVFGGSGEYEVRRIEKAIDSLREARDFLHSVGADRAAVYVRRALKSAEGARRHAERIWLNRKD